MGFHSTMLFDSYLGSLADPNPLLWKIWFNIKHPKIKNAALDINGNYIHVCVMRMIYLT